MALIDRSNCALLVVDIQVRLMPAIDDANRVTTNADKLVRGASLLDVPILATEQSPQSLGGTVERLLPASVAAIVKTTFDACKTAEFVEAITDCDTFIVAGCEAHVCVLQTVLGLIQRGKSVYLVADAVGSRTKDSRDTALRRMERSGAELVTTEMVLFEWLKDANHPAFREVLTLIK